MFLSNCRAENVEITDEEIEAEIKRLAETWKMEADKVREYMDVDLMRKDMSAQKALDMITDAAVGKIISLIETGGMKFEFSTLCH